jgi:hypothetical protein
MSICLVGYSSSSSDSEADGSPETHEVIGKRCGDHAEQDNASKRQRIETKCEDDDNGIHSEVKVTKDLAGNSK